MASVEHLVQRVLEPSLAKEGFERVEIVPLPERTQRLAQLRTLEDLLEAFESGPDAETGATFIVHVRRRGASQALPESELLEKNGHLLLAAQDWELARVTFQAMLGRGERPRSAHLGLALAAEGLGQIEASQRHFEEALAFGPSADVYTGLIRVLARTNQPAYRMEIVERALQWGGCDAATVASLEAELTRELGIRAYAKGEKHLAHTHLCKAMERNPEDGVALEHLLKVSLDLRQYEPAQTLLSRFVERQPVNPNLLYCLAGLRFHLGHDNDAEAVLRQFLRVRPEDERALQLLQRIQRRKAAHGRAGNSESGGS